MKKCGTCKYFDIKEGARFGECRAIHMPDHDERDDELKVYCVDGSDYYAAVRCRKDFGCVLWERKE